ncbi:hydroxyacylglutathione hydrolase [Pseudoalteromonas sp. SSDWG2]|uniref:hydroxyacylglutathione hydrolase n=1 Tax=Pseudoalteromonas sp. SSDWG2 TaxID=3139391 RepID=UPI003BAB8B98
MAQVEAIKAFSDNYIWALHSKRDNQIIVVDPGQAEPVLDYLKRTGKKLAAILITHHHWDHTTGVAALKQHFPRVKVYGPKNSPFEGIDVALVDGNDIEVLEHHFHIIATPGHTLDHICYQANKYIFCGDTLFSAGCGRLFEGSAEQMWQSMQKFIGMDDKTLVYCTHEYTQANLDFATACMPNDTEIAAYANKVSQLRSRDKITLPSSIGREKRINPFLRPQSVMMDTFPAHLRPQTEDALAKFTALRLWKDDF